MKRSRTVIGIMMSLALIMALVGAVGAQDSGPPDEDADAQLRLAAAMCTTEAAAIRASSDFRPFPGLSVTIDNGRKARTVLVNFAADIFVDRGAEVRLAYAIDNGPPQEGAFGPSNIANHQEFWETRSTIAVVSLGKGVHTITPYWRVSGAPQKLGRKVGGCMSAQPL